MVTCYTIHLWSQEQPPGHSVVLLRVVQLVRHSNTLHVGQLRNGACGEALVHQAIVHKHVGNAEQCDAEASPEAEAACHGWGEEAVEAQRDGWHGIHDGVHVVGLQGR